MVGQYQQDELDFKTTGHPHGELYEQRQIERGLALCMQGGYLAVYLPYGLFPRVDEPPQTGLQSGYVGQQAQGFHGQSVFISFLEKVNARTAEGGTDDHEHRHSGRHFPAIEPQVKEDGESPETEMGKDVHHGIQNHAGCRLGRPYVRCQFHNTVRLAAEKSHRSDVVQRITADRVLINLQKRHFRCRPVVDDDRPRPGVGQIEKDPQEDDGRKPISRPTDVVP